MAAIVILLLLVVGCVHGEPAAPVVDRPHGPLTPSLPRRLTYNPADDRTASWLPGGAEVVYSSEREDHADHDRCLRILAPDAGTVRRSICPPLASHDDSTDVFEAPAVSTDGRIAYLRVVSRIGQQKLGTAALVVASMADPTGGSVVTPIPYRAPSGRMHSSVGYLHWLEPGVLVYLGQHLFYQGSTFFPDTFVTGVEVMRVDVRGPSPTFEAIPGTEHASSVSVADDGALVYTLGGDSRVYRRDPTSGATAVLYDFGPGHVVRDAEVRGNRLVAVVDGSVLFQHEPANGFVQRDEGGDLHFVNLAAGAASAIATDTVLFRRPRLAPAGDRVVVEASPWAPVHVGPDSDYNATNHRVDLWLFEVP
ncbi:MAG TPA: hypothetical protein VNK43_01405 [Gemmatimonadales bacterium]|nr:hypothetical protein [Gemmatimonadales bacterium]